MDLNEYQEQASHTASFEGMEVDKTLHPLLYVTLGLTGEAGEVAEKVKKMLRNDNGVLSEEKRIAIKHELGDVLWYISQAARLLDFSLSDIAQANIDKLKDRRARGVIKSEGDNR